MFVGGLDASLDEHSLGAAFAPYGKERISQGPSGAARRVGSVRLRDASGILLSRSAGERASGVLCAAACAAARARGNATRRDARGSAQCVCVGGGGRGGVWSDEADPTGHTGEITYLRIPAGKNCGFVQVCSPAGGRESPGMANDDRDIRRRSGANNSSIA